jgi:hypothetical protein
METLYCKGCEKHLSIEEFSYKNKATGKRNSKCRNCHCIYRKKHYEENRKWYIDLSAIRKQEKIKWWKEYKKLYSCKECGENHPACICFHHHNDNKEANVSKLVLDGSIEALLKEIEKCIPLCANCHAKIHWKTN